MIEWNFYSVLALILGGLALVMLARTGSRRDGRSLEQRMQEFADQAVEIARQEHQWELDFGLESIALVERILMKIHSQNEKAAIPERELSRIVLTWGGYVGVVLSRKFGGTWKADSAAAGPNTYPLQWPAGEAVPVIWCLRQIRNGAEASIASKIAELVKQIEGFKLNEEA